MTSRIPPELRDDPLFLTARTALALTARCRRALKEAGIEDVNPAQFSLLCALDTRDDFTPTELAREVRYEKSTLTPLLERLEQAGLMARARDPDDARVQRLSLTRKGRRRRREVAAVFTRVSADLLAPLARKVLRNHVRFCEAVLAAEDTAGAKGP
jgi:DNA-binding MarR family transcriptional regulator